MTELLALLATLLVGLGLGALLRRPRTGGTTPTPQRPEPAPDTTTEEIDDAILHDTPHTPRPAPADHPGDDPDVVATVSEWTDDTDL